MIKEFCAENFTKIPQAIQKGANRIELCDNLAVGGTTPSTGVIEEVLAYAGEHSVPVMTIIRPRGGNFVYNDIELKIMHTDLIEAKKLGTDGIVIGCLTEDGWLDEEALDLFIETAEGLQITFHMAFDALSKENQFKAIDWLAERGVTRILTHGGPAGTPIEDNFDNCLRRSTDSYFTRWRYFHRKRSNCDGHFKSHRSPWHKNCLISCI